MTPRNTGYLGDNVTMEVRHRMRDRYLSHRLSVDLGWRAQCRCGATRYTRWRARWYCIVCARWVRRFPQEVTP